MKTLLILTVAVLLPSCAGLNLTASSPWGDVSTVDGVTVVTPKPIVIPSK